MSKILAFAAGSRKVVLPPWIATLNSAVLAQHKTRLVGGFREPFYQPALHGSFAEIRFNRNFERSALHELAHWCIAGENRRTQQDYGYWYAPEPRTQLQQKNFFASEIDPQAIEKCFCDALGIEFEVSVDNLSGEVAGIAEFRNKVYARAAELSREMLPERTRTVRTFLTKPVR